MTHSPIKNKGILDKSVPFKKLTFHKKSSYNRVLAKCISEMYPENKEPATLYYLANSEGHHVCMDGIILIEGEFGAKESVPWNLDMYIKILHVRFPSKVKLYCVYDEEQVQFCYQEKLAITFCRREVILIARLHVQSVQSVHRCRLFCYHHEELGLFHSVGK